jgi:AraC-like DNA-binding protein
MNKTDYLCRLIRHAANVPVERIQLNEFVPAREALNSRVPSLAALAENEVRTAVQAYAGLLHVISTIKTHYIVLPTQEMDEAILIGPYRCSEPVYRRVKSILHDRGYWGVQSTDIRAYFSSVAKADESWILEIVQIESRHLFGTEPHIELIDAQTSNMDARERCVMHGLAERRKEDRQQLVKAVAQGAYTAAGEWLSKLLDWKLDTPMRMQCAACNEMFLSAVLQNPAVEPLEAEELYHIWMCKAESIPGRETLFQMLEEYCALVRRPVAGRSSTLFLDARNYVSEHLNEELRPADIANALGATENRLIKVFREETGGTVLAYIRQQRLLAAKELLETTDRPIEAIGQSVGIPEKQALVRNLTKLLGCTPAQYRKRARIDESPSARP